TLLMATIEGSLTTMPLPLAYTSVLAVPRSIARSLENMLNSERRLWNLELCEWNPLDDINSRFRRRYCNQPIQRSRRTFPITLSWDWKAAWDCFAPYCQPAAAL